MIGRLVRIGLLLLAAAVTGCALPVGRIPLSGDGLRPGVGAGFAFDTVRPRVGQRVIYRFEGGDGPFEVRGDWRIAAGRGDRFQLKGQIQTIVPGIDLTDTVADFARRFGRSPLQAEGDRLVMPFDAVVDRRMRTISSRSLFDRSTYAPHDCFATLGTCRFTQTDEAGRVRHLVSETTEAGGIWREVRRYDPTRDPGRSTALAMELVYTVDKSALIIDALIADYSEGGVSLLRLRRLR